MIRWVKMRVALWRWKREIRRLWPNYLRLSKINSLNLLEQDKWH